MSEQVDGFLHYDYNVDWTESLSQLMVFYIAIIHPRSRCTLTWATPLFFSRGNTSLAQPGQHPALILYPERLLQMCITVVQ